jgi:hypothetical protein
VGLGWLSEEWAWRNHQRHIRRYPGQFCGRERRSDQRCRPTAHQGNRSCLRHQFRRNQPGQPTAQLYVQGLGDQSAAGILPLQTVGAGPAKAAVDWQDNNHPPPGFRGRFKSLAGATMILIWRSTDSLSLRAGPNYEELWDLFDVKICLILDETMIRERLTERSRNLFGKAPAELEAILRFNAPVVRRSRGDIDRLVSPIGRSRARCGGRLLRGRARRTGVTSTRRSGPYRLIVRGALAHPA